AAAEAGKKVEEQRAKRRQRSDSEDSRRKSRSRSRDSSSNSRSRSGSRGPSSKKTKTGWDDSGDYMRKMAAAQAAAAAGATDDPGLSMSQVPSALFPSLGQPPPPPG
ncbi:unnamed protein product, partial [Polarella glacialis]